MEWQDVFNTWLSAMKNANISLNPLFTEIVLHDPVNPNRRDIELFWCKPDDASEQHLSLQRTLNDFPGCKLIHYTWDAATPRTLRHLWTHKDNVEKIAAIMISATLSDLTNYRKEYEHDLWPPFKDINELRISILENCFNDEDIPLWDNRSHGLLPTNFLSHSPPKLETVLDFVGYIAKLHILTLTENTPVALVYKRKTSSVGPTSQE